MILKMVEMVYPDACDPKADGEVMHYAADDTCVTKPITIVRLVWL